MNRSLRIKSTTHLYTTRSYLTLLIKDYQVCNKFDILNFLGLKEKEHALWRSLIQTHSNKFYKKENKKLRNGLLLTQDKNVFQSQMFLKNKKTSKLQKTNCNSSEKKNWQSFFKTRSTMKNTFGTTSPTLKHRQS